MKEERAKERQEGRCVLERERAKNQVRVGAQPALLFEFMKQSSINLPILTYFILF